MGRKRDKGFDGGLSRRRTILQIEKPSLKAGNKTSKSNEGSSKQPKAHNPLGLLASYGDSDDDDDVDEKAPARQQQSKGGFIGVGGTKPANEMDGMVADFLAEIDALDPDTPEHPSEPDDTEQHQANEPSSSTQGSDEAKQEEEVAPPQPAPPAADNGWQELLDENTNCIYYWNTITNEVTWETPADFNAPVATAPPEIPTPTSQPSSAVSSPVRAPEPIPVVPEEAPLPEVAKKEPEKVITTAIPKVAAVREDVVKDEVVVKKVTSKPAPVKQPVLDMFADEVSEQEKEPVAKKASSSGKMPVYGASIVEYDVPPEVEEPEEDIADEEPELTKSKPPGVGMYSMFVKGDSLPASKDRERKLSKQTKDGGKKMLAVKKAVSKMPERVVLAHLDITEDDRGSLSEEENRVNGEEDEDDDVVEMEMGTGDDIDIDQQLEMALERKKAELAELEEMEERGGSQSPPAQKRKISSPLNIYDENGEVNLLSFKKKRLENLKQQQQSQQRQTCDQETQCDEQLIERLTEDFAKDKSAKSIKEEMKLKTELSDLGSTLTSKLEFLGQATSKGLSKLQVLLVEIETRILDWREGALDGKHLLRKLQLADWELQRYESEAAPPNWTCTWNRTHRQYYYTNSATGDSQWDYPIEALGQGETVLDQSMDEKESRAMFNRASSQDDTSGSRATSAAGGIPSVMMRGNVTAGQLNVQAAAPTPPVFNKSAPPPPSAPSPEPPPLPDGAPPLPRDPPPPGTGPDLPPLPPSPPPPPPSPPDDSDDDELSTGGSSRPLTPPPAPPSLPPFTTTGGPSIYGEPPPPPPPESDGTVIGKPQILYTSAPSAPASSLDGTPLGDYGGAPVAYGAAPVMGPGEEPIGGAMGTPQPQVASKSKRTKKMKKSSAVKKKMPISLVEKWKQIQEAQVREEEEKRRKEEEEDMVVDPALIQQKRIAEWKKQQMEKGKSAYNPNFETIQGDWRERLKRKGSKQ